MEYNPVFYSLVQMEINMKIATLVTIALAIVGGMSVVNAGSKLIQPEAKQAIWTPADDAAIKVETPKLARVPSGKTQVVQYLKTVKTRRTNADALLNIMEVHPGYGEALLKAMSSEYGSSLESKLRNPVACGNVGAAKAVAAKYNKLAAQAEESPIRYYVTRKISTFFGMSSQSVVSETFIKLEKNKRMQVVRDLCTLQGIPSDDL